MPVAIGEKISGARLLLVEDQPIAREVAAGLLTGAGARVTLARHGLEALEILSPTLNDADRAFSVILLDERMPVLDGLATARMLRADPGLAGVPIIAMFTNPPAATNELAALAEAFLVKPLDAGDLFAVLERLLPARFTGPPLARLDLDHDPAAAPTPTPDVVTGPGAPTLPGLDRAAAFERLGGRLDIWESALEMLPGDCGTAGREAIRALAAGDRDGAASLLHRVKGVAANVAATKLHAAAVELESALRQGATGADLTPLVTRFEENLDQVLASIAVWQRDRSLETSPGPSSDPPDRTRIAALMGELATLLRDSNYRSREVLAELKKAWNRDSPSGLDRLEECVRIFDMDEARRILGEMVEALEAGLPE